MPLSAASICRTAAAMIAWSSTNSTVTGCSGAVPALPTAGPSDALIVISQAAYAEFLHNCFEERGGGQLNSPTAEHRGQLSRQCQGQPPRLAENDARFDNSPVLIRMDSLVFNGVRTPQMASASAICWFATRQHPHGGHL